MKHIKDFKVFESSEPEVKREYYPDGSVKRERWSLNGEEHRKDGPALIEFKREYYPDGSVKRERWFLSGEEHRKDGPAWIDYYPDGTVEVKSWYLKGLLYRKDRPAWIVYYPDGKVKQEVWSVNNKWHRVDGPAIIQYHPDGKIKQELWSLNGKELSKAKWVKKTPGLSAEELVEISNTDPDPEVRRAAKNNPNFPEDLEGWSINLDDWT